MDVPILENIPKEVLNVACTAGGYLLLTADGRNEIFVVHIASRVVESILTGMTQPRALALNDADRCVHVTDYNAHQIFSFDLPYRLFLPH